jgi:hypothetical protein
LSRVTTYWRGSGLALCRPIMPIGLKAPLAEKACPVGFYRTSPLDASTRLVTRSARAKTSPAPAPGVAGPISCARKRIGSAKATEPPHLGQTLLLRGKTAVVVDAFPGIGRAPASAGPRRLAPLRARPALGISVGEQQSHYCGTEQNKTDRAHGSSPSPSFVRPNAKGKAASPPLVKTIGIVDVAALAACAAGGLPAPPPRRAA